MAYLDFVKTKGKTYVYVGEKEFSNKKTQRICGLGQLQAAFCVLRFWSIHKKEIPEVIKTNDYARIPAWIDAVRDRGAF
ncbi:hypothetical protein [Sporosarcina limicola]|uniref:Uncharacterized protein n=1 Tax=Sporosarcina limicola TaxID=34101 RepID=A0A927MQ12_9BACL|nr:hypothetical protein [Sporosarcina limicola]MBE1555414.1 hypothetical protein [Sporosarcina limicola]